MTDNEMAKLHVRYMVGGHAPRAASTNCCSASSSRSAPARCCGSSTAIGSRWNISLFHYRNHGSDYGRVLAGIQVPPADARRIRAAPAELHYPYTDETANPAYRMFLGHG